MPTTPPSHSYIYGISIAQFLIGVTISALNCLIFLSIATNSRLRTGSYCFLANIWFSNLLLGIIVAVSNVVDDSGAYVFKKTEGTVSILNGFVNISMLLALITQRFVAIRRSSSGNRNANISTRIAFKIIICTWAVILGLTLIKAIVFGLDRLGTYGTCFDCFLIFEITVLVVLIAVTLLIFLAAFYCVYVSRNRSIGDSSMIASSGQQQSTTMTNRKDEYDSILTSGLLIFGFSSTFIAFVSLIAVWLSQPDSLDPGVAEIVITVFYTHCLINPIIVLIRDSEIRKTARDLIRCRRPDGVAPAQGLGGGAGSPTGGPRTTRLAGDHSAPDDPRMAPVEETPRSTPPKYGSTTIAEIHDEIPPPIGGVVGFMSG